MSCETDFQNRVSILCLDFFNGKIPAKGKPQVGKEWTVYSAIVMEQEKVNQLSHRLCKIILSVSERLHTLKAGGKIGLSAHHSHVIWIRMSFLGNFRKYWIKWGSCIGQLDQKTLLLAHLWHSYFWI